MFGYIYKTTNLINGKIYIGQHKSKNFDENYKGSGVRLHSAINKYGWDNFKCEILEECNNKNEMNDKEKNYIKLYDSRNPKIGYNLSEGGEKGFCLTEESYKKIVETRRKNGTISGWKKSKESIEKTMQSKIEIYGKPSVSWTNKTHHSDETKNKIGEGNRGKIRSEELKQQISKKVKETCSNEEYRNNLSEKIKQKWQDPEYREKMSHRKRPDPVKISNTLKEKSKIKAIEKGGLE